MIEDITLELTGSAPTGQAVTASGFGSAPLNIAAGSDPAVGEPLVAMFQVTQNFNTLTSLTIAVENDDDGAGTNAVTLVSQSVVLANLTVAAGAQRLGIITPQQIKRAFLTEQHTVVGSAPSTGKLRVWLQKGADVIPVNPGAM